MTRNRCVSLNDLAKGVSHESLCTRGDVLDETVEGRLELNADLVPSLGDLFPDGYQDGRTAFGEAETGESVDLRKAQMRREERALEA